MAKINTESEQKAAARRVLVDGEGRADVAKSLGVSYKSVCNWIGRWGQEVSGAAMDAAASGLPAPVDVPPISVTAKTGPKVAKSRESIRKMLDARLERVETTPAPEDAPEKHTTPPGASRGELARIGAELGAAVCHINDEAARATVARAAWRLTQAAGA